MSLSVVILRSMMKLSEWRVFNLRYSSDCVYLLVLTYAKANRYNREYISVDLLWNFVKRHSAHQVPLIHVWYSLSSLRRRCWHQLASLQRVIYSCDVRYQRTKSYLYQLFFFRTFSLHSTWLTCVCSSPFAVIQKRRTPVCQFASPLDVDIHSNPQVSSYNWQLAGWNQEWIHSSVRDKLIS